MDAITKDEMVSELKAMIPHMEISENTDSPGSDESYRSIYLGTVFSLDPCGKYHHALSPNGATEDCETYWETLEEAANELGGWIESGEGDPCDQFFCLPAESTQGDEEPDINF